MGSMLLGLVEYAVLLMLPLTSGGIHSIVVVVEVVVVVVLVVVVVVVVVVVLVVGGSVVVVLVACEVGKVNTMALAGLGGSSSTCPA
jgi:hypothetical protein